MSETSTSSGESSPIIAVNSIALIAGISVIGTILLVVIVVACIIWCNKIAKQRRRDRSRQYMVHDGASPYSSVHGASSAEVPSYNGVPNQWGSSYFLATGYDNKAIDGAEFRPNPLAENPFQRQSSLLNLPPNISDYNVETRYNSPRYTQSTQSLNLENDSFYASLYSKLGDTTHMHQGRPLYVCKREHYRKVSDYFDIIGKTRTNDWLIKPRKTTPNRPPAKKNSHKQKAPKPGNTQGQNQSAYRENGQIANGYTPWPGASSKITTPFGPAERMPTRYPGMSQAHANGSYESGFTSLPRDGKLHKGHREPGNQLKRQASSGAADRPARGLDQQQYAQVMKKNALNRSNSDKQNPSRRQISTIEESPLDSSKTTIKRGDKTDGATRERSASVSTVKSVGKNITDQFQFLDQYETEEERF